MTSPKLQVKLLDARATLPRYHSEFAAGLDLSLCLPRGEHTGETLEVRPGTIVKAPTGLAVAIAQGFEGQVRPRSGLATRHGLTLPNSPGTIDADYRGELFVALINLGPETVTLRHGDRIAQMIIAPVARADVAVVEKLPSTQRGDGGFGSTGVASATS